VASGTPAGVTVTFAGSGDAFGSGGRTVLTHMSADMLGRQEQACCETAHDGLVLRI
jgi:hypothetical protein